MKMTTEDERVLLVRTMGLPPARAGIEALKNRLPPIFSELIQSNLPELKVAIATRLGAAQAELAKIGAKQRDPTFLIADCRNTLLASTDSFKCLLSIPRQEFQDRVHNTEKMIQQEWVDAKLAPNDFDCPFFQGNSAFLECLQTICDWWRPILCSHFNRANNS